jgi:hypothetical protein
VQVLSLSKIAGTAPQHFRVVVNGPQGRGTLFGAEQIIRKALAKAGVSVTEIDRLFNLAKVDSGNRER